MRHFPIRISASPRARLCKPKWRFADRRRLRYLSDHGKQGEPLRILFCGSDEFSIASLQALHEESKGFDSNILSIDVVTKKDKKTGRGLKITRPPPIKASAHELGLPIHQIDTFTGWSPPEYGNAPNPYINLVVAVSFGLLIPPRILNNSKYGGLNVHPSMLPDLHGPAPIQWTIIHGRHTTGVSLQTLHPSKFDRGIVLAQSAPPGLAIPNHDRIRTPQLRDMLAPIGAKMLVDAIRDRLYIPPYKPVQIQSKSGPESVTHAPKITTNHCAVDFHVLKRDEILRRNRAISPLYALATFETRTEQMSRINFGTDMRIPTEEDVPRDLAPDLLKTINSMPSGVPYAIIRAKEDILNSSKPLLVHCGSAWERQLVIPTITISSMRKGPAAAAAARAKLFQNNPKIVGKYKLYRFAHPLSLRKDIADSGLIKSTTG